MAAPPIKVLNLFPFGVGERAKLEAASERLRIEHRDANDQDSVDALEDSNLEVLIGSHAPADLSRVPRLKWVASVTAGVEEIVATDPWRRGIVVTNGSGLHVTAMGEYVLAAMLQVTQRIRERDQAQVAHRWPAWRSAEWTRLAGTRLRGKTVAIIGYGSVGREVARLAKAAGMRILAVKARPSERADRGFRLPGTGDPEGDIPERIVGFGELPAVLSAADFVVLAAPLTQETRGLIGEQFLSAMRSDAWLVNIGRGGHADEDVLITALREHRIAGAILDVFEEEPLPASSPFWDLPNVIITPHFAGAGGISDFWPEAAQLIAENLRRYTVGEDLLNVVDPKRGY